MKPVISILAFLAWTTLVNIQAVEDGVVNFKIDSEELKLFEMLLGGGPSRLGTFKYSDCGDTKTELISIGTLVASPDPISFPGTLGINFKGEFKTTLDAPLKASVVLERKIGDTWIKIPCIGSIGSCSYDDLCELLSGAVCPPPFVTNKVPCKCPFNKGVYQLPNVSFEVDAAVFPPGDYRAQANLTTGLGGQTKVGCINLLASFA